MTLPKPVSLPERLRQPDALALIADPTLEVAEILNRLGIVANYDNARKRIKVIRSEMANNPTAHVPTPATQAIPESQPEPARAEPRLPSTRQQLMDAQMHVETETIGESELETLRKRLALLERQITWAQHAKSDVRTGGKVTIVSSDRHYTDRSHLIQCCASMELKSLELLSQYQPDEIVWIENGDAVAGRGIYKEQNVDSCIQQGIDQIKVAAVKLWKLHKRIAAQHPRAKITWKYTNGNHDRTQGEPLGPALVLECRGLGVPMIYAGDACVTNLASQGTYNLYAEHGYGYSDLSPSSKKWLNDMKDKYIRLVNEGYYGEKRIRRVTHGHTHWHQIGMERANNWFFDTTGGTQRNERVLLGKNERPMGWIAYVSPAGMVSDILAPIGLIPDEYIAATEMRNPYLFRDNAVDSNNVLVEYLEIAQASGVSETLYPDGR